MVATRQVYNPTPIKAVAPATSYITPQRAAVSSPTIKPIAPIAPAIPKATPVVAAAAKPTSAPVPTQDQQRQNARSEGYLGAFGGGGYDGFKAGTHDAYGNPIQAQELPGVQPLSVEPLNPWQQQALLSIFQGAPNTGDMAAARGLLDDARGNISSGTKAYSPTMAAEYFNPFKQQVIDNSVAEIMRQKGVLNSQINSAATNAGAFGSTRDAVQRGLLDESTLRQIADTVSRLSYQGYGDAVDQSMGQFNTERGRDLSAAGVNMSAANGYQGLRNNFLDQYYTAQDRQLGAGNQVQQQNQAAVTAAEANRQAENNYTRDLLSWYASALSPFSGNQTQGASVSPIQGALGGGLLGYSAYNSFAPQTLPWQTAGNINPLTGRSYNAI